MWIPGPLDIVVLYMVDYADTEDFKKTSSEKYRGPDTEWRRNSTSPFFDYSNNNDHLATELTRDLQIRTKELGVRVIPTITTFPYGPGDA